MGLFNNKTMDQDAFDKKCKKALWPGDGNALKELWKYSQAHNLEMNVIEACLKKRTGKKLNIREKIDLERK